MMNKIIKTSFVSLLLALALLLSSCSALNPFEMIKNILGGGETVTESESETESETLTETESESESVSETESESEEEESEEENNVFWFEDVEIILPDFFYTYYDEEEDITYAIPNDYPDHEDTISFKKSDGKFKDYTYSNIQYSMQNALGVELNMLKLERVKIEGRNCVIARSVFRKDGKKYSLTEYSIFFSSKSVHILFVDVSGKFTDQFTLCGESIKIVKK